MLHINEAVLLGNVGGDPEVRTFDDGGKRVRFRLATNRRFRDRDGNQQERTDWHSIVVFAPWADSAGTMVRKGQAVMVRGRIEHWEGLDGQTGETRRGVQVTVAGPGSMVNVLSPRRDADGTAEAAAGEAAPEDAGAGNGAAGPEAGAEAGAGESAAAADADPGEPGA